MRILNTMYSCFENYVFMQSKLCFHLVKTMFSHGQNIVFTLPMYDFCCQNPAFPALYADSQAFTRKNLALIPTLKLHWNLHHFSVGKV